MQNSLQSQQLYLHSFFFKFRDLLHGKSLIHSKFLNMLHMYVNITRKEKGFPIAILHKEIPLFSSDISVHAYIYKLQNCELHNK